MDILSNNTNNRYNEYLKVEGNFTNDITKNILEKFLVSFPDRMDKFSDFNDDHCFYCQSQLSFGENVIDEHKKIVQDLIIRLSFQKTKTLDEISINEIKVADVDYKTAQLIERMPIGMFPTLNGSICKVCSEEFISEFDEYLKENITIEKDTKIPFNYGTAVARYANLLEIWINKAK